MDISSVAAAVAGGLVGGALVPFLSLARDRRSARSSVRLRLAEAERARWARQANRDTDSEIYEILSRLEVEAVVAGIPRSVIELYVVLAEVGYDSSHSAHSASGATAPPEKC